MEKKRAEREEISPKRGSFAVPRRKDFISDVAETYNEESYWPMIMDAKVEIRVLRRSIKRWQPSKEDSHE
jgi:hypothetical protein